MTRALESLVSGKKHLQDSAGSQLPTPIWTEAFPGKDLEVLVDAALATFALHVESRIASAIGEGFLHHWALRRRGACGGWAGARAARSLRAALPAPGNISREDARGWRKGAGCSAAGPSARIRGVVLRSRVLGHALLPGRGANDFLVTSTLASQATPAVGRALGGQIAQHLGVEGNFATDFCSYVSFGDGSVNNAHFLSGLNLAEYAHSRSFKVPILFGISNNDLCISLKGNGWLRRFAAQRLGGSSVIVADGRDAADVLLKTREARRLAASKGRPSVIIYDGIVRRFGHAATDRQAAYLSGAEIEACIVEGGHALERICEEVLPQALTLESASPRFKKRCSAPLSRPPQRPR